MNVIQLEAKYEELFRAAAQNDVAALLRTLESGANPNFAHPQVGNTPLYNACFTNSTEAIKILLQKGANPNFRFNYHSPVDGRKEKEVTALMYATSPETARLLIEGGAEINAADYSGNTSLMRCAFRGSLALVKFFLSCGASPLARQTRKKKLTARELAESKAEFFEMCIKETPQNEQAKKRRDHYKEISRILAEAENNFPKI